MRGREAKGTPPADLLVCFPSRAHLTLMPKSICSPARHNSESSKHHHNNPHHHHHRLRKSNTRGGGQASPLLWTKNKSMGTEIAEPTSPKVTCAGQIKVRPKTSSCRSWQSVVEEIEKIHKNRKQRKRPNWVESLGFKKEIMQFLTCLRSIRFDLQCFGSFPESDRTTDEDEEDDHDCEVCQENHMDIERSDNEASRTVFSKWFMVLQENQNNGFCEEDTKEKGKHCYKEPIGEPTAPPPNALLLMRCRSAPVKSWLEEKKEKEEDEEQENDDNDHKEEGIDKLEAKKARSLKSLMEEEKRKTESLVVMRYDSDFYKISSDIAKETWVVGGIADPLSRSRSWKR
ncbi:nucleolar GTP-binding protein 2 [Quillaja saponaria]|uniref:Nucleolar GTP-binding protein 2 n=1 Tax=Quillaja saponaria TaxID=32244 RepID=A0AAD7LIX6_QUISA|nr:nucleolar GTP-binding protein 2 [Quillaja saponaria]